MRAAPRLLVLVVAFLISVIAAPAYASDDSPGLLDSVVKTVESLTKPSPKPAAETPKPTGPVTQLTSLVDNALGGQTSLSNSPLVKTVDKVLAGKPALPTQPTGPADPVEPADPTDPTSPADPTDPTAPQAPAEGTSDSAIASATSAGGDQIVTSRSFETVLSLESLAESPAKVARVAPATAEEAYVPGTSTLPDGGSPLTLAWLVLAVGATAAGATVIRRTRTSA